MISFVAPEKVAAARFLYAIGKMEGGSTRRLKNVPPPWKCGGRSKRWGTGGRADEPDVSRNSRPRPTQDRAVFVIDFSAGMCPPAKRPRIYPVSVGI